MASTVCAGFLRIENFDWEIPFRHTILPSINSSEYLVTQEFPGMWQWWSQIGCGLALMIASGQTLAYFTYRKSYQRQRTTL
ncbi:uncharacterized protein LOC120926942 isoform X2 [Rana temporaria]|uniref:uncharacterized protein LOC120926942 isoform X2 n=1 Tax=Rana temporaria TaxID=8407 RepID=UPI001AAD5596|nr:uncharacterized protein LOC120926942 isoform X2 [Rana temporaria]